MKHKLLLSINYKLFLNGASDFVNHVKEYDTENKVSGFELYFDDDVDEEKQFALELAKLCHDNNYILNIHSRWWRNEESYKGYLRLIDDISAIYGDEITLTLHPAETENIHEAEDFSKKLFAQVLEYVKKQNYRINLCVENLNKLHGIDRLTIWEIWEILKEIQTLNLTHDIGHELIDKKDFSQLYGVMLDRLSNIHIHNYCGSKDHFPIRKTDWNIDMFDDIFVYLRSINYDKTIVLEYAADYIDGNTKEEILKNYIMLLYDFDEMISKVY